MTSEIIAPPRIEIVGSQRTSVRITSATSSGAPFRAHTTNPMFRIDAAPEHLPGARDTNPQPFELSFAAPSKGRFESDLVITLGVRSIKISLVGYSSIDVKHEQAPNSSRPTRVDLGLPSDVDLGERVVGTHREIPIGSIRVNTFEEARLGTPTFFDPASNTSRPTISLPVRDRTAAFYAATTNPWSVTSQPASFAVGFAPKAKGDHDATMEIPVRWQDGEVSKDYVRVRGRARDIAEAPEQGLGDLPTSGKPPEVTPLELGGDPTLDFRLLAQTCANKGEEIATKQRDAVTDTQVAARYGKQPKGGSFLEAFLEAALTMAAGGIAGVFAKTFSKEIGNTIQKFVKKDERQDLPIVNFANDAIKEGLKTIGKPVAQEAVDTSNRPKPKPKPTGFFKDQRDALTEKIDANRQLLTNTQFKLEPKLKTSPQLIVRSMEATLRSLEATKAAAYDQQQVATESQWVAAVAKTEHSIEQDLGGIRTPNANVAPEGVLRLQVKVLEGKHFVSSAKLLGIGKKLVAHMGSIPLKTVPVPLAIHVVSHRGTGTVTRDHHGVVRVEGALPAKERNASELDKLNDAEELLSQILSQSLDDWGVAVQHDDTAKEDDKVTPE